MTQDNSQDFNSGHRQRLKQRFMNSQIRSLPDYEILEMVLFTVFKRSDTKPLAKQLLKKFGSLAAVLNAEPLELKTVAGIGEAAVFQFRLLLDLFSRMHIGKQEEMPVLSNWKSVLNYCNLTMGFKKKENFRIFYLNRKNALIVDEIIDAGTVDKIAVYPSEIVKQCITHGASAIILVHNHPSGDPSSSKEDVEVTNQIASALKQIEVAIHDHLVIAQNRHYSFRGNGLLVA